MKIKELVKNENYFQGLKYLKAFYLPSKGND